MACLLYTSKPRALMSRQDTRTSRIGQEITSGSLQDMLAPVSYTHLDVYKRQPKNSAPDFVHPLANDFADFLRLLLACSDSAALEQVQA